jgi:hypothetical protein
MQSLQLADVFLKNMLSSDHGERITVALRHLCRRTIRASYARVFGKGTQPSKGDPYGLPLDVFLFSRPISSRVVMPFINDLEIVGA